MQKEKIDSAIHSFYYIKHKKALRDKKNTFENNLKALLSIVKFIRFRGIFCRDFADFFP